MLIHIGYDIELALDGPTTVLGALHVHPARAHALQAPEALRVAPDMPVSNYRDSFGNTITRIDVPAWADRVHLHNRALVADSGLPDPVHADAHQHAPHELPMEAFRFLLPSRYCEVDSELMPLAWKAFGGVPEGWPRVQAVCDFVHGHLRFDYQQARATRTAMQGWQERVGVCRDYTHLAITLCRCLNIPARYVTGYLGDIGVPPLTGPMDFSAWFEVYLGDRWHSFDARHNTRRIGRIAMARGRDAADVPITMSFGRSELRRFEVVTEEWPAGRSVTVSGTAH